VAQVLLGGHVERRAEQLIAAGQLGVEQAAVRAAGRTRCAAVAVAPAVAVAAGQAEIADPHRSVAIDQDIGRLEVAMDDAGGVGDRQAAAGGDEPGQHLPPVAGAAAARARERPVERGAVDELHRQEDPAGGDADVVDRHHARMRQPGQCLGLAPQPRLEVSGKAPRAMGPQQLERDVAVELGIARGIDHTHAAAAEQAGDDIAAEPLARLQHGAGLRLVAHRHGHGGLGGGGRPGGQRRVRREPPLVVDGRHRRAGVVAIRTMSQGAIMAYALGRPARHAVAESDDST
jgi:hypothetical protein